MERTIEAGTIVCEEDTEGEGHAEESLSDEPWRTVILPFPDAQVGLSDISPSLKSQASLIVRKSVPVPPQDSTIQEDSYDCQVLVDALGCSYSKRYSMTYLHPCMRY